MNLSVVVNVTVMMAMIMSLSCPAAAWTHNNNYRYGKQQLAQKQFRYGNPTWFNGLDRTTDWATPYDMSDVRFHVFNNNNNNNLRHYPGSMRQYQTMGGNSQMFPTDDYFDTDAMDYAVVRYPSSGNGYYPAISDFTAYESPSNDDMLYDDILYGDRDPMSLASAYYDSTAAINSYSLPQQQQQQLQQQQSPLSPQTPLQTTLNKYETRYHPTDKIHKYRKVFKSNLVSPSNAFKSTKEQQLYDFWESMIQNNQNGMDQLEIEDTSATSQLYKHLPQILQKIQRQQKQIEQRQLAEERTQSVPLLPLSSSPFASSLHSSQSTPQLSLPVSQTIPHENHFKQWANGSPLYKRSSVKNDWLVSSSHIQATSLDNNDDVRQLEQLKAHNVSDKTTSVPTTVTPSTTTKVSDTTTMVPLPMADGGQREYVLPRPAGEKSNYEILMELLAEGRSDTNAVVNDSKLGQDVKSNKKRSFVSDETTYAAQLGALRKN